MNMEIKLIKEKQSQSNGNALWGIINRTNQPMVSNIVQSSQKYHMMKKECDGHLHVSFLRLFLEIGERYHCSR